ncbi:PhzF family phenazine biosynthesis protein [Dyadobacter subterraneus]|uniref:PhzF family phenazine biosynthesis protein n=1 Tax=Dyadobacter subterraneus TaxID=2773304 RepID=A0ABR9WA73_9BACT|nr:PhzF family phenazine biosynthesis protein [Dyadobacter subterraneus]MBE9462382.1 PhzF family phenazine biosynthesis protein [Dyadobacter subterraneus]
MKFGLYQIDAFTEKVFEGNPACVVPLESWLPDEILLKITRENAVAETAFFVITGDRIHLRWFTPEIEMDLCGHATLATAHALKTILNYPKEEIIFDTLSGELVVSTSEEMYFLNFPSRKAQPAELPENIKKSLNIQPKSVLKSRDYVLVYDTESEIRNIKIDRNLFDQENLDPGGVIVTAKGDNCDFVSRFFTPQASILEDPVTGSAHCTLIPYWSELLGKKEMKAEQISERSGKLLCFDNGDRVLIGGKAKTYSEGNFWIE